MENLKKISIKKLLAHPQNPRIAMREDVVSAIAANLTNGFDPAHALIVRPVGDAYQIISGHHRWQAANQAGIESVPCWVRDMDDDEAYMALVTSNSQGELSPLEIGMHALHCVSLSKGGRGQKGGLSAYAKVVGKDKSTVSKLVNAASVATKCGNVSTVLSDKVFHLSAIHALPDNLWKIVVGAMIKGVWSAKETTDKVKRIKEFDFSCEIGKLFDAPAIIAHHLSYSDFAPVTFAKLVAQCHRTENTIKVMATDADPLIESFRLWVKESQPKKVGEVQEYEREIQAALEQEQEQAEEFKLGDWRDHIGELDDGSVHLLLTDPPYGMDYQSNRRKERHEKIANDGRDEAASHLRECLVAMAQKMAANSHALIFTDWRNEAALSDAAVEAGLRIKGSLIWVKNNHGSGDLSGAFAPKHERIIHAVKGKPALVDRKPDVFDAAKPATDRHPTEKPVELLQQLIEATTVKGELVADPFAGVASTLVAAKNSGRRFWGCELSDSYHEAGRARL